MGPASWITNGLGKTSSSKLQKTARDLAPNQLTFTLTAGVVMQTKMVPSTGEATTPKVSICIPTYCGGKTIGPAIESVFAQSLTDFELIVIDDGSTDNTRAVVESFADPRLKYFLNPKNLGPEGNWNRCLELASGEYFKLLPHDDLLHRQCLERQSAVLDADTQETIALVFCARDVIGPSGKKLTKRGYPNGRAGLIDGDSVMRSCVRRGTNLLGEPGAVLLRKSLANKIGLFDATNPYVIDLDYWFRLLAHGNAYFFEDSLASFRVSPQSWSVIIGGGQDRDFINFSKRMYSSPKKSVTAIDMAVMQVTSRINKWLRLVFYSIFLNKSK